jgi:hypothetical protein
MIINKNLNIEEIRAEYLKNKPNYVVIENLFNMDFIKNCEEEFLNITDDNFFKYSDKLFEYEKYALNNVDDMPHHLKMIFNFIHSSEFIKFIESITSLNNLHVDEDRWGGGIHKTKPGGYLSMHRDFNVLPETYKKQKQYLRTINLIGYLTDEDQSLNDGYLEFWNDGEIVKIENKFNNWVIFDTRMNYHGHPYPFKGEKPRMSIASYYYLEQVVEKEIWMSTDYLKLPWMEDSEEYQNRRIQRSNPKLRYSELYK